MELGGLVNELLGALAGVAGVAVVSAVKPIVAKGDGALTNLYKSFQPVVAMAAGIALPAVGQALGIVDVPSGEVFAAAPIGTVVAVSLREVLAKVRKIGGAR